MKKLLFFASALVALASCSNEDVVNETSTKGTAQSVKISVADFVADGASRAAVAVTENGTSRENAFTWTAGDAIGVYPATVGTGQTEQQVKFNLTAGATTASATFTGTGWGLICNGSYKYYAYYPYSANGSATSVPVTYTDGLNQTANGNTAHLGVNDFLYAPTVTPASVETAQFNFKHLSALLECEIQVPNANRYTKFQVTAPDATTFVKSATYDPSQTTADAAPTLSNVTYTKTLTLKLNGGRSADFATAGFEADDNNMLHLFFLVGPANVSGKTLTFKLWDSEGKAYLGTIAPTKDITAQSFKTYIARVTVKEVTEYENLSVNANGTQETANCYIVSENGKYKFLANVKGNGVEVTGGESATIASSLSGYTPAVVWETVNTTTAPSTGAIVSNVHLEGNYITFDATGLPGNALIALKNGNDIVWSWHIWSTGADLDADAQVYPNNAGTMMDRNLGALSATAGNAYTTGLLYQWGRPCPFPGAATLSSGKMVTNGTQYSTVASADGSEEGTTATGNLAYSAAHPTVFITSSSDWMTTQNDNLWGNNDGKKTMYDPCPIGWKMPAGGSNGVWNKAGGFSKDGTTFSWANAGRTYTSASSDAYYPATGYLNLSSGSLISIGSVGRYWSSSVNGAYGYELNFYGSDVYPSRSSGRAYGFSVRPCKE